MLRKLPRLTLDQITQGMLIISGGQIARMVLGLVSSVIIAQSLGSSDFGLYGVLAATTVIAATLADIGLTTTVAQQLGAIWPEKLSISQNRARVYFWTKLGAGFMVVAVGMVLAEPFTEIIFATTTPALVLLLRLAFLGVGAIVLNGSTDGLLRATRHFRRLNLVVLTNAGLTVVLAIALRITQQLTLVTALAVLGITTSLASFVVGRLLLPPPIDLRPPGKSGWRGELKRMLAFSRWIMLSNVLLALTRQLDVILVNRWHTAASAGTYFLALNLAAKLEFLNHSQHTVLVPEAANLRGTGAMLAYARQRLQRSLLIALAFLPLLWLIDPFVRLLYGEQFAAAIPLFRWLLLIVLFDFVTLPLTLLFLPLNRPGFLAAADLFQASIFLVCAFWFIPTLGPMGAILAKGIAKLCGSIAALVVLTTLHRQSPP